MLDTDLTFKTHGGAEIAATFTAPASYSLRFSSDKAMSSCATDS